MKKVDKIMHSYINTIPENSILFGLLKEIEMVTEYPINFQSNSMVIHYLDDLISRRPITKLCIDAMPNSSAFLLKQKIGKIEDPQISMLCQEIANNKGSEFDDIKSMTLYVFLDRYLKANYKPKKRKPKPLPGYAYS